MKLILGAGFVNPAGGVHDSCFVAKKHRYFAE